MVEHTANPRSIIATIQSLDDSAHVRDAAGRIGIALFIASEIMFFVGLLGAYIVLRAGSPTLFARQALSLDRGAAIANTVVLLASSLGIFFAIRATRADRLKSAAMALTFTLLCGGVFLGIKLHEYRGELSHHTIVVRENRKNVIYDGSISIVSNGQRELTGFRSPIFSDFNIFTTCLADVRERANRTSPQKFLLPTSISEDITCGPWKSVFFACYYLLTAVHGLHIIGGMVAIFILLIAALRDRLRLQTLQYVAMYWYFVEIVWLIIFPLLYLS